MRIKRANFRFNRLVNVDDIIGHSDILLMEQEGINVDNNVHDCILEDNANIMVLQNNIEPHQNRIVATNGYNGRFRGRIVEAANDIANHICGLYNTFINDNNTSYVIQ